MAKIRVGIDPGKNGAIAEICDDELEYRITPLISKEYNEKEMNVVVSKYATAISNGVDVHVLLENVHSLGGVSASSNASLMDNAGFWRGLLTANKIPFTLVTPKEWQKEMWQGIKTITKAPTKDSKRKQVDTKATSLLSAQRLFPSASFLASDRCSVPHDGIVDAVLMAEYCRRRF